MDVGSAGGEDSVYCIGRVELVNAACPSPIETARLQLSLATVECASQKVASIPIGSASNILTYTLSNA
jgi:hypothetical protein